MSVKHRPQSSVVLCGTRWVFHVVVIANCTHKPRLWRIITVHRHSSRGGAGAETPTFAPPHRAPSSLAPQPALLLCSPFFYGAIRNDRVLECDGYIASETDRRSSVHRNLKQKIRGAVVGGTVSFTASLTVPPTIPARVAAPGIFCISCAYRARNNSTA